MTQQNWVLAVGPIVGAVVAIGGTALAKMAWRSVKNMNTASPTMSALGLHARRVIAITSLIGSGSAAAWSGADMYLALGELPKKTAEVAATETDAPEAPVAKAATLTWPMQPALFAAALAALAVSGRSYKRWDDAIAHRRVYGPVFMPVSGAVINPVPVIQETQVSSRPVVNPVPTIRPVA